MAMLRLGSFPFGAVLICGGMDQYRLVIPAYRDITWKAPNVESARLRHVRQATTGSRVHLGRTAFVFLVRILSRLMLIMSVLDIPLTTIIVNGSVPTGLREWMELASCFWLRVS